MQYLISIVICKQICSVHIRVHVPTVVKEIYVKKPVHHYEHHEDHHHDHDDHDSHSGGYGGSSGSFGGSSSSYGGGGDDSYGGKIVKLSLYKYLI